MQSIEGFDENVLRKIKRYRRLAVILVAGYLPLGFALFFLHAPQGLGTALLILWLISSLLSLVRLRLMDCPQCGQLFYAFSRRGSTNLRMPFGRSCIHCGFLLYHRAHT
jgi:hypothetical protein